MDFTDKKLEIAIALTAVVFVASSGYLLKAPVQKAIQNAEISFEMARPKSFLASLFDLGDREIARNYVNPFAKKKEDAKKEEAKKADAAKATTTAQKKASDTKKKADEAKKPSVEMQVVGADPSRSVGGDDLSTDHSGGANNQDVAGAKKSSDTTTKDDSNTMTGEQWRSLVLGQPTKENVNKMVVAYMNKEISDTDFYGIVTELMHNSNSETQALGLSAVSSFYNVNSFSVVASSYSALSSDVQTKADAYLLGYAAAGRLGVLASALKSSTSEVVEIAAQIVVKGYQSAKSGVTASSTGDRYRGDAYKNSTSGYTQFVTIFESLAQSSDTTIASIASSALSQIQSAGIASL